MSDTNRVPRRRAAKKRGIRHWPLQVFRLLFTSLLVACIAMIFSNSLEIGVMSSARSVQVTEWLNRVLARMNTGIQLQHVTVRKMAHVAQYAALGFLLMLSMRVYTARILGHISWPLFLGLLVAVIDECLQLLVPGRSGELMDVALDFAGVLMGVLLGLFVLLLGKQFWQELVAEKA